MYKENNRGPRIDPWGTPQVRRVAEDEWAPKLTEKLLLDRKDWNHLSTVPVIPIDRSSRDKRILWSTKSKAELRSNSTKAMISPASAVIKISLRTFRRADSVLWRGLYSYRPWCTGPFANINYIIQCKTNKKITCVIVWIHQKVEFKLLLQAYFGYLIVSLHLHIKCVFVRMQVTYSEVMMDFMNVFVDSAMM